MVVDKYISTRISARFTDKIVSLIGQGTFGKVVKAFDKETQTFRAVTIIRAVQKYRESSYVEIRVLKKLKEKDPQNDRFVTRFLIS